MNGNEFKNVRLDFEKGRIVKASCDEADMSEKLLTYIDTDEGSRYLGEVAFGTNYARTVSLFYCLLAFSHCCAGILRGMGRPIVPMAIMLAVWCALRITYITITVSIIPDIRVVYWAYPLTWSISSVLFALCLRQLLRHMPEGESQNGHIHI